MRWLGCLILGFTLTSRAYFAPGSFTVSGISSGGFMADQLAVSYSQRVKAAAIIAGGYFYCAENHLQDYWQKTGAIGLLQYQVNPQPLKLLSSVMSKFFFDIKDFYAPSLSNPLYRALTVCMKQPQYNLLSQQIWGLAFEQMKILAQENKIDPLINIKDQKYLLYHGGKDQVVDPQMQGQIEIIKKYFGNTSIKVIANPEGGHNFPTAKKTSLKCHQEQPPYVGSCQLDLASEIINYFYPEFENKAYSVGAIRTFVVSQDTPERPDSIAPYGYAVASDYCMKAPKNCKVHVALHGCKMSDYFDENLQKDFETQVGRVGISYQPKDQERELSYNLKSFVELSGFAEAIANKPIIVVFPQTQITQSNYPLNPAGCWDWYGWTGRDYAFKSGSEMSWLMNWLSRYPRKEYQDLE